MALATVTLTPLMITVVRQFVIKPLLEAYESRKVQMYSKGSSERGCIVKALHERKKHAEEIKKQIKTAESAQNLQKVVAQRMMEQEALKSGLVIIKAEFGIFPKSLTHRPQATAAASESADWHR